jgi:hypothetical protein
MHVGVQHRYDNTAELTCARLDACTRTRRRSAPMKQSDPYCQDFVVTLVSRIERQCIGDEELRAAERDVLLVRAIAAQIIFLEPSIEAWRPRSLMNVRDRGLLSQRSAVRGSGIGSSRLA